MAMLTAQIDGGLLTWLVLVGVSLLAGGGFYAISQHRLTRAIDKLRNETEARIEAAAATIRLGFLTASDKAAPAVSAAPQIMTPKPQLITQPVELSPETVLLIAAAATAFLEKRVRVRSAKLLQRPYTVNNVWAQQGRIVIQASHNLAQIRHWD